MNITRIAYNRGVSITILVTLIPQGWLVAHMTSNDGTGCASAIVEDKEHTMKAENFWPFGFKEEVR